MATKKIAAKPAVEQAPAEDEGIALEIGMSVRFVGYAEGTPDDQKYLEPGAEGELIGFTDPNPEVEGDEGGNPILRVANPQFNAKKKEHPDTNPKEVEVEVMADEIEVLEAEVEPEPEPEPVKAAPAKTAKAAPAKAAATPAKAAAAPGKTKVAPAKAAKPAKVAKEPEPPVDKEAVPELQNEDAAILELVNGAQDLIATAQELDATAAATEWQLGGVLYHIKKAKLHRAILGEDGKPVEAYQQPGGFDLFLKEYFNVEYRKAMYLIDIYVNFTQAGIENPAERLAQIGWTKASKIARHMVGEGAKPDELLELAENNTVSDLSEAIKDTVKVGGTPGVAVKRLTLKFRYLEADAAAVSAILDAATATLGLKDVGQTLQHILTEWASEHAGGTPTKTSAPAQRTAAAPAAPAARKAVAAKRAVAA